MDKSARSLTVLGTALVHNYDQGKDYKEDVEITFALDESGQTWEVQCVVMRETEEVVYGRY